MKFPVSHSLLTLALGAALSAPAAAQSKPSIAIMPTQYFSADADSAKTVTAGLATQWERQGYTIVGQDKSDSTFQTLGLNPSQHYSDQTAIKFGKSMGADLVAYPRLLAVGLPLSNGTMLAPEAVLHLRVLNVHTGSAIYFRQIGHEFRADAPQTADAQFTLPQPIAEATAQQASELYFQRVAGSRQEFRGKQ